MDQIQNKGDIPQKRSLPLLPNKRTGSEVKPFSRLGNLSTNSASYTEKDTFNEVSQEISQRRVYLSQRHGSIWNQGSSRSQALKRSDAAMYQLLHSRRQREQFRKKLVDLILFSKEEDSKHDNIKENSSGQLCLNSSDREKLRYHYYIHNGINTEDVAPLADSWLENILSLVPRHLKVDTSDSIIRLCTEVRTNYLFCVKKAIVEGTVASSGSLHANV